MQLPDDIRGGLHGCLGGLAISQLKLVRSVATITATGDEFAVDRDQARQAIAAMRGDLNRIEAEFTKLGCLEAKAARRADLSRPLPASQTEGMAA